MKHINTIFSLLILGSLATATEVKMQSLSFEPRTVEITQGQSITWKNEALTDHSATSNDTPPAFDTGLVSPGKKSKALEFNKVGDFNYHCSVHGKTMSGLIHVKAK